MSKWLLLAFGLILLFAAQRECAADGKFMPPLNVKAPDMPQQRAIIVYRDGVERLIIESAFQGEAGDYAWILPVPSEPLEIKKASYGLFKTMFHDLGRKALEVAPAFHWLRDLIWLASVSLMILLFAYSLATGSVRAWGTWGTASFSVVCVAGAALGDLVLLAPLGMFVVLFLLRNLLPRAVPMVVLLVAILLAYSYAIPSLAGIRGGDSVGLDVKVLQSTAIGDYQVTALSAKDAEALDAWLTAGGFQTLGPVGKRIAQEYIAKKWCFVVGKMRKTGAAASAPEPIEVSVKVDAPVYPMKLTALAGGPLYLDLIVVAADGYEHPDLETEFCREFKAQGEPTSAFFSFHWGELSQSQKVTTYFASLSVPYFRQVVSGEAGSLLWDGCVISKLSGTLTDRQMADDIRPTSCASGKATVLMTDLAALQAGVTGGVWFLFFAAVISSIALLMPPVRRSGFMRKGRMYLWIAGLAAVFGLVVWFASPSAGGLVEQSKRSEGLAAIDQSEKVLAHVCARKGGPGEKLLAMYDRKALWPKDHAETDPLLLAISAEMLPLLAASNVKNPVSGGLISFEQERGNLALSLEIDGRIKLTILDVPGLRFYEGKRWYPEYGQ